MNGKDRKRKERENSKMGQRKVYSFAAEGNKVYVYLSIIQYNNYNNYI